ncbi:MAG: VOC family protein [Candidatus Cloacimonetes bacterium]|nr:VOC family protein [Candidatus Cloacimonadota bacterium]
MKDLVVWFEIPANDFQRAVKFYNEILQTKIVIEEIQGELMGFLQMEGYADGGAIVSVKDRIPSENGTLIFLNGGDDLNDILKRIEAAGGKVINPKTLVSEAIGYYALFNDSEGNRLALHSKK